MTSTIYVPASWGFGGPVTVVVPAPGNKPVDAKSTTSTWQTWADKSSAEAKSTSSAWQDWQAQGAATTGSATVKAVQAGSSSSPTWQTSKSPESTSFVQQYQGSASRIGSSGVASLALVAVAILL